MWGTRRAVDSDPRQRSLFHLGRAGVKTPPPDRQSQVSRSSSSKAEALAPVPVQLDTQAEAARDLSGAQVLVATRAGLKALPWALPGGGGC